MIDLILHAADGQTLVQFARTYGLFRKNPDTIVYDTDPDSPTFGDVLETIDNGWRQRRGFEYSPWAGSGKFMTTKGTYDAEGAELTAPQYVAGLVYLVRLSFDVADEDQADEDETETGQAAKSKIVRWAKRNGTIGSMAGGALDYAEVDGVKVFQPDQINAWLSTRNLPGHEWLGGNSY